MLQLGSLHLSLCQEIQDSLAAGTIPSFLLKNVYRHGPKSSRTIRTSLFSFIQPLNDECTKAHLQFITESNIEVIGVLKPKSIHLFLFQPVCMDCGGLFSQTQPRNTVCPIVQSVATLTRKQEVDKLIRDTLDKVLVLRFGRATDIVCMQLDEILAKSAHEVSKFASIALVDVDAEEIQVYIKYFDITLIPATIFFFNAHHMKMDSGTPDHTKWIGAFHQKQDFIDVIEAIFRGAMKGKVIVMCPLPPERIPKFQLLFKDI